MEEIGKYNPVQVPVSLLKLTVVPTHCCQCAEDAGWDWRTFWPPSGGVTDSLQLNHSGGRLSAWQDNANRPSHLFCHFYSGEARRRRMRR